MLTDVNAERHKNWLFFKISFFQVGEAGHSYLFTVEEQWIFDYSCSTELHHPLHFIYNTHAHTQKRWL